MRKHNVWFSLFGKHKQLWLSWKSSRGILRTSVLPFLSVKRALKRLHFSSAQRHFILARSLLCSFHLFVNEQKIV